MTACKVMVKAPVAKVKIGHWWRISLVLSFLVGRFPTG